MHFLKYSYNLRSIKNPYFSPIFKRRYPISLYNQILRNYHKPGKPWPRAPNYKKKRLMLTYYNIGLYCLVFGICYSIVPLYKLFCEHVGLEGDLEQKDYSMKDKKCT